MITVNRVMGIETEYALVDRDDPSAEPEALARDLLFAYARKAAQEGATSTQHVPSATGRDLLPGAGCRFDYSGELPTRDARDGTDHDLAPEARTDREAGSVLTGSPVRWISKVDRFGQHYYRGSATHAVNGGRLYVDHTHPEYASPETSGPLEAALYDRAGDLLMHEAEQALSRERGSRLQVIKNNTDGHGSAWGAHESYAVRRETPWELLTQVLMPFLVSRQVLCGSGRVGIGPRSEAPGFQVLARADYVEQEVSLYTTRSRPVINTRDEPHAQASLWRRLHVITADSSCLAVSSLLRTGSTAAVLSLIEEHPDRAQALAERLTLADPVSAIRDYSHDPGLTTRCALRDGRSLTALEIQQAFLAEVLDVVGQTPDQETRLVLDLWGQALEALGQGPAQAAHLVEWCAKLALLQRLRDRYGCGWEDPRIQAADLQFSLVDPEASLASRLERAGAVRAVLTREQAQAAVLQAPQGTRAGGRSALLRAFPEQVWAASWTSVVLDTGTSRLLRVTLPDPLSPTASQVEQAVHAAGSQDADALLATLRHLGLDVPAEPEVFGWDEDPGAGKSPGTTTGPGR